MMKILPIYLLLSFYFLFCIFVSGNEQMEFDSETNILRIPEHRIHHDPDHHEELVVERLYKPENCDDEYTRKSKIGDNIAVRYIGKIDQNSAGGRPGMVFDKSGKTPFSFRLGSEQVIRGWDEGLIGMCAGEKRRLTVPPNFGYKEKGTKGGIKGTFIPPHSTLDFEVELVGWSEKVKQPNIFDEMDTDQNGAISYKEMEYWFANKHPQKLQSIPIGVWERDDKNQDGVVTWEEFSGPKGKKFSVKIDEF